MYSVRFSKDVKLSSTHFGYLMMPMVCTDNLDTNPRVRHHRKNIPKCPKKHFPSITLKHLVFKALKDAGLWFTLQGQLQSHSQGLPLTDYHSKTITLTKSSSAFQQKISVFFRKVIHHLWFMMLFWKNQVAVTTRKHLGDLVFFHTLPPWPSREASARECRPVTGEVAARNLDLTVFGRIGQWESGKVCTGKGGNPSDDHRFLGRLFYLILSCF